MTPVRDSEVPDVFVRPREIGLSSTFVHHAGQVKTRRPDEFEARREAIGRGGV